MKNKSMSCNFSCVPYKTTFSNDRACVHNQQRIRQIVKAKASLKTKKIPSLEMSMFTMDSDYYKIRLCHGCKFGEELYKLAKKQRRLFDLKLKGKQLTKEQRAFINKKQKIYRRFCQLGFR